MKILKTFGRDEYILTDEEATNLETLLVSGKTGFIKLKTDELINVASIEAIKGPNLIPRYKGYPVSKDGAHFYEDGEKIAISKPELIEYVIDPKYLKMANKKLLK